METIGIGIIGFGWFGELIADTIVNTPSLCLVAIAEPNPERREWLGMKFPEVRPYHAAEQLLGDKNLSVVVVATPPVLHTKLGWQTLAANKHLFLEKPGALNTNDMAKLKRLADSCGLKASIDFVMRRNPLYFILKQLQDKSVFGQAERALLENYAHDDHLPPNHWFWDLATSGGIWIEHGVHFFDLTNWLFGPVNQVKTDSFRRSNETLIDRVVGTAVHDNGCIVSYYHGFTKPELFEDTSFNLVWERAYAHMSGWIPTDLSLDALITPEVEAYIKGQLMQEARTFLPGIGIELVSSNVQHLPSLQPHRRNQDKEFRATARLRLCLKLSSDRWTVYRSCIREGLLDLCRAAQNPDYEPAVTLNDAYQALKVAVAFAHGL